MRLGGQYQFAVASSRPSVFTPICRLASGWGSWQEWEGGSEGRGRLWSGGVDDGSGGPSRRGGEGEPASMAAVALEWPGPTLGIEGEEACGLPGAVGTERVAWLDHAHLTAHERVLVLSNSIRILFSIWV
jgi:hypothetical protein